MAQLLGFETWLWACIFATSKVPNWSYPLIVHDKRLGYLLCISTLFKFHFYSSLNEPSTVKTNHLQIFSKSNVIDIKFCFTPGKNLTYVINCAYRNHILYGITFREYKGITPRNTTIIYPPNF